MTRRNILITVVLISALNNVAWSMQDASSRQADVAAATQGESPASAEAGKAGLTEENKPVTAADSNRCSTG